VNIQCNKEGCGPAVLAYGTFTNTDGGDYYQCSCAKCGYKTGLTTRQFEALDQWYYPYVHGYRIVVILEECEL